MSITWSPQNARYSRSADNRLGLLGCTIVSDAISTTIYCSVQGTTNEYEVNLEYHPDGSHLDGILQYKCSCPDFQRRNAACKHIYFIFCRVLKFRREQLGNVSIVELFTAYGKYRQEVMKRSLPIVGTITRKAIEEDDECPICFDSLTEESSIWCKTTCGNNIHRHCMQMWKTLGKNACPLCRSDWND